MTSSVFFLTLCVWSAAGATYESSLCGMPVDSSTFRLDYEFYPQADGWLKLHRIPLPWFQARLACYLEGAHLASPITNDLAMVMRDLAKWEQLPIIHTGIHSWVTVEDYYSCEGIHLSRIPVTWKEGEPNNLGNKERCLVMLPQGVMADADRGPDSIRPFFCYKKKQGYSQMNECGYHDKQYIVNPVTGHCYKFHDEPMSWYQALTVCTAEGGTLAVINSEAEAKFIKNLTLQQNYESFVHVGFYSWFHEKGHWTTMDGTTLKEAGFERWLKNEPNNLGGQEYCGTFIVGNNTGSLELNDSNCMTTRPFVCEIPPHKLHRGDDLF